ncbi:hypothetical protein QL285_049712 [Trifolium repens]|nr:hypothetical protein QL285_049712 [Trifolium repens]
MDYVIIFFDYTSHIYSYVVIGLRTFEQIVQPTAIVYYASGIGIHNSCAWCCSRTNLSTRGTRYSGPGASDVFKCASPLKEMCYFNLARA